MNPKPNLKSVFNKEVPEVLRDNLGFLLNKAARIVRDEVGNKVKADFSLNEYGLLRMLELGSSETQQEMGERLGVDRTSMVNIVDRLEERGLVERKKDRVDRRKYNLTLTEKGKKTLTRAKRHADQAQGALFSSLKKKQQDELRVLLLQILAHHYERDN